MKVKLGNFLESRKLFLSVSLCMLLTIYALQKSLIYPKRETEKLNSANKARILCWILTSPTNRLERAVHVQNTWGKRCDKLLLMSSRDDNQTDIVVGLPVEDGYEILWNKTVAAFQYLYAHNLDDADWFVKADDDT